MAKRDFYEVLGVAKNANQEDVKKSYRKLARQFHPDKNPDDKTAEVKFKEVQEAYDVLSDADKRRKYDQLGHAAFDGSSGGPGGFAGGEAFDFGEMGGGIEDLLSGFLGGRKRRTRASMDVAGQDIQAEIFVPFKTAALGGELEVTLPRPAKQQLAVRIPPGLADGDKLRLAGKGMPAPSPNGKSGDLIVVTRIEPHPFFTRKGVDLYLEAPISMAEAILGADLEVPTLEGRATISAPSGSSSGQKLRLRGKGVPQRDGQRGDLYVQLKIVGPKAISPDLRKLAEAVRDADPAGPRKSLEWF